MDGQNKTENISKKVYCENFFNTVFGIRNDDSGERIVCCDEFYEKATLLVKSLPEPKDQIMDMIFREGKDEEKIARTFKLSRERTQMYIAASLRYIRNPRQLRQFFRFLIKPRNDST